MRRRSDIAKRNHLGREGGRGDVAATFVKVAAMSLRLSCDLNFLLGTLSTDLIDLSLQNTKQTRIDSSSSVIIGEELSRLKASPKIGKKLVEVFSTRG